MASALRAAWAPVAVFVAGVTAANSRYDIDAVFSLLHVLGGAALVHFFSSVFATAPRPLRLLLSFSLACTGAVFWEIGEFALDSLLGTHLQEGNTDTMSDLILGAAGAAAWAVVLVYKARRDA